MEQRVRIAADEIVGRRRELRLLTNAVKGGKAVLLVGLPGVSKTTMVRALAADLGGVVDVTGDEQLTAHALVGTFDPPMVLEQGYRPEHFIPGPLVSAMRAGQILYVEELNRAPSGALNALLTALSDRYLEVPRLGRVDAAPGFTVIGAANPLDDVGTARLSRGLADRFLVMELDYQSRDEELEIVRRRCGRRWQGLHAFAVDVARESRGHPELRHGASVRAAIDFVDLLSGYKPGELDLNLVKFVGCSAYAGRLRVRPTADRTACAIVHELIDAVLARHYQDDVLLLIDGAAQAASDQPAATEDDSIGLAEEGDVALPARPGGSALEQEGTPGPTAQDDMQGRVGASGEDGESRSRPILDYNRPINREARFTDSLDEIRDSHLADLDEVLDRARDHVLSPREGAPDPLGRGAGQRLASVPLPSAPTALLDVEGTVEAVLTVARNPQSKDFQVHVREHQTRNYVILVDHSGSMTGGKLQLAATLAALLAQLSAAGRADYAVIAFEQGLVELKSLGEDCDVENVVERILRLPEGRFTDLGAALAAAAERAEALPDATDVVLISDCMPTRGVLTFEGLAELARQIPSLYVCYTYEPVSATQLCGGRASRIERYQSWARRWVGEDRFAEVSDVEEFGLLIELLSREGTGV